MRNIIPTEDEKILLAHIDDLYTDSIRNNIVRSSCFLTEREQRLVSMKKIKPMLMWGGYESAERKRAIFIPEYFSEQNIKDDCQLAETSIVSVITNNESNKLLSHRDFLGAVLGLGLKREMVGDIIIDGQKAVIIIDCKLTEYIIENLKEVGRYKVKCEMSDGCSIKDYTPAFKEIKDTVASLRLDNIIASAFNISRNEASDAIKAGKVFIDGIECKENDETVQIGEKMTLRGKGKVILYETGGTTNKGRLRVTFHKLI